MLMFLDCSKFHKVDRAEVDHYSDPSQTWQESPGNNEGPTRQWQDHTGKVSVLLKTCEDVVFNRYCNSVTTGR